MTKLEDALLMCFDLETTGVNTQEDRIVQIGVSYFHKRRALQRHQQLINPGVPIPEGASGVHGITDARVAGEPRLVEVLPRLKGHFSGEVFPALPPPVLVGYNLVSYDLPLFEAELRRAGASWSVLNHSVIDVFTFVRWHLRHEPSRKLSDIAARFNIHISAHDALSDAHATGLLLGHLFDAGYLPPTVEQLVAEEGRLRAILEAEYQEYGNWLYHQRQTGELVMGTKRHTGQPPEAVDPGFFRFILSKNDTLPPKVRAIFEGRASAGR
jgi:DNA polymerase-3 subunit epsilon